MKNLRFRAWHKQHKTMYRVIHLDIIQNTVCLENSRGWYKAENAEEVLMQKFTGLTDRRGACIYEGDIVRAWSEGKEAVGEVRQRIDGLWIMYPAWQGKEFWGLCPNPNGKTTVEVIGNIYENPELIWEHLRTEKKKKEMENEIDC